MGAARRFCVRAMVLAGMIGAILSVTLPACQFPHYDFETSVAGASAGTGGMSGASGGAPNDGGDGGSEAGSGGADVPPPPCSETCVPSPPSGWSGPIAFWEGQSGNPDAQPVCPLGAAQPALLHRELQIPGGGCECKCAAQDQVCDENTSLHIFVDMSCATECTTASAHACDAVSGCTGSQGSVRAEIPAPSGGSCQATVGAPSEPTWAYDARLCQMKVPGVCDQPNTVCTSTPPLAFTSELCIAKVLKAGSKVPDCPAEYPSPNEPLYESFFTDRECTACGCSGIAGGSCSGTLLMSGGGNCTSGGFSYTLGSGCKQFDLGSGNVRPSRVGGKYTVVPGACSVASAPQTMGNAVPDGQVTVVCCRGAM